MTHHTDAELLPCPFCGDHAETDFIPEHLSYAIECHSIGCAARVIKETAEDAVEAWNRRAPAAPVPQDAATHNNNLNGFIDFANQIDFAKPRSASLKRKFILETRDAILELFRDNLKLRRKVDALTAAPQPPEAAPVREPLTADEIKEPKPGANWRVVWWNESCRMMLPADKALDSFQSYKNGTMQFTLKQRAHGIGGAA